MSSPLLQAIHITKQFGGITALRDVDFELEAGRVTALIGENGAGKSTLLKIMSGIHLDYEGEIWFSNQLIRFQNPKQAQQLGISIIHQELNLIPELTIAENIFLGDEPVHSFGFIDSKEMLKTSTELLQKLRLDLPADTPVKELNVGQQQIVEIAKALRTDSKVVFMDEPTSALGEQEIQVLFEIIEQLRSEGRSVVYISHKLDEIFQIADDYVILRDGQVVDHGLMADISGEEIVRHMSKRKETDQVSEVVRKKGDLRLSVQNLTARINGKKLNKINFDLHKGEVLGIYGLMGAGRTELLEALFGLHPKTTNGTITLNNHSHTFQKPADAITAGIALVPEDRKQLGFVAGMSVRHNASLTMLDETLQWGLLNKKKESNIVDNILTSLNVKTSSSDELIENLSGGNQQKVVLGKWLARNPSVLMLDEPTRGIDVGAKQEIYRLIHEQTSKGMSVIVSSSEIPEILELADRILVLSEGQLTAHFDITVATEEKIMNASLTHQTVS